MPRAEHLRTEAGTHIRTGRQILDEHVGRGDDPAEKRSVGSVLDVKRDRLLAPVEPGEIGAFAMYDIIIASREIALGTLDLYDPGTRIGETRGAKRRGDGLFKRDDRDSGKWPHHQKDLGRPSTWVATWLRIKFVEMGAT